MTPNAATFRQRQSYWQGQGLSGIDILVAMQSDAELPSFLAPDDLEDIEGIKPVTVVQRRARKIGPPYIMASQRQVIYPTCDYLVWLCERYANPRAVNGDHADRHWLDPHTRTGKAVKKRPKRLEQRSASSEA